MEWSHGMGKESHDGPLNRMRAEKSGEFRLLPGNCAERLTGNKYVTSTIGVTEIIDLTTTQGRLDALLAVHHALIQNNELGGVYATHFERFIKQLNTKVAAGSLIQKLKTSKGAGQ